MADHRAEAEAARGFRQLAPLPDDYGPDGALGVARHRLARHLRSLHGARLAGQLRRDGRRPAARVRPRAGGLLAELAREHPPLRPQPSRDRDRPARLRRVRAAARGHQHARATAASWTRSWARSASSAPRSSATRWAASSRPRSAISHPSRVEKLVLVSAAGVMTVRTARAGCGASGSPAPFELGPRACSRGAQSLVRRRRLRKLMLYGIVRHPGAAPAGAGATRSRAAAASPASSMRSRRSSTTTSATACRRSSGPTLIVWGRNDRIVPVGGAYRVRAADPGLAQGDLRGHRPRADDRAPGAVQPAARRVPRRVAGGQPGTRSSTASWRTSGAPLTTCSTSSNPRASSSRM